MASPNPESIGHAAGAVDHEDAAAKAVKETPVPQQEGQAAVPSWRVFCITAAMFGVAFNWGAQYSRVTPVLQELGLQASWLGIAWLAGPVSGMFVQPWVGYQSDRTTHRWGRRRIWMLAAMLGLGASNLGMAFAPVIAKCFVAKAYVERWACALAIVSFWLADVFINMVQGPHRTLIVDLLPSEQLGFGNACMGVWEGLGKISAFAVGSFPISRFFPAWRKWSGAFFANVQIFFMIGNLIMVLSFALTLLTATEKPWVPDKNKDETSRLSFVQRVVATARGLSLLSRWVWLVLCCTNFAWFVSWMYIPAYMGTEIMGGDPDAPPQSEAQRRYMHGADFLASQAMLTQSALALAVSPLMPMAMRRLGAGHLWILCELLRAAVYCLTPAIHSRQMAIVDLGLQGVAWAAFLVIPYTIIGCETKQNGEGSEALFMSLMNLALCVPELVASLTVGPAVLLAGGAASGPIVMAGGACLLAAIVLVRVARLERSHFSYEVL